MKQLFTNVINQPTIQEWIVLALGRHPVMSSVQTDEALKFRILACQGFIL